MASIKKVGEQKRFIRVSKQVDGKRQWLNQTFRGTAKDASAHARSLETLLDKGHSIQEIKQTFGAYAEYWLETIEVKKPTRQFYSDMCRLHAHPLNSTKLMSVKPKQIQNVYDDMKARLLHPNTVRHLHATLRNLFNFAVKHRHLKENPCHFVVVPKKVRTKVQVWGEYEAARIFNVCQTAANGIIIEFALETGMRPEEYLAIHRDSINFQYGTASVDRALIWEKKGGGFYFEDTKTDGSRRLIPLSDGLLDRLRAHLATHDYDLVFANGVGHPYSLGNLTKRYLYPILREAGVHKLSLYSLRHTMATMLLIAGENPKVVSERLGHASVVLTLDTYSHVLPHIQAAATQKLSTMLRGAHLLHTSDEIIQ